MTTCELKIGTRVQDKVTGATGMITAKADYLYGEPQFLFEYRNDCGSICASWFPSSRLLVLEEDN